MKIINTVGIVGAGTMGSALAQKFAMEGMNVVLVDRENSFLERGLGLIRSTLAEGVQRRLFRETDIPRILERISTSTEVEKLIPCQLVIEAVFEDLTVKTELFSRLGSCLKPETILATNTSSFSVDELSSACAHPEYFLGLHFFYHAAKNRLVEIVRSPRTQPQVFEHVFWFLQRCGKDPIICRDAHGFVVNRFFVPWLNEAVRLLEDGLASPAGIDRVACQAFGCGMGPFALMNATGVPIAYHAACTLGEKFGPFYAPAQRLLKQMELNQPWELGMEDSLTAETEKLIQERLVGTVLFVCGQLLDEEVCKAGEIHRGAAIGLRWRKTPLFLYQKLGRKAALQLVGSLAKQWSIPVPEALTSVSWQPDYVQIETYGTTGVLVLNRPEGLNALNPELLSQLETTFTQLEQNPAVETIVLLGRGKAFMAGADIRFFITRIKGRRFDEIVNFTTRGQKLFQRIDDCKKQVIAVVNGLAFGGGLELALTADKIVVVDKARLAFPETGIGIYPGLGGTQRTVQRVGKGLAKYLIFTGRPLNARSALATGLVDQVIPWEAIPELLADPTSVKSERPSLSRDWLDIQEFFDCNSVNQLLFDTFPSDRDLLMKSVRSKARRALEIAERLIEAQAGPTSELEFLQEIFSTKDALVGLESVGKTKPQFTGV